MRLLHTWIGYGVVAAFGVLWLWALLAWLLRRADVHRSFWTLLAAAQAVLVLQVVAGIVLLVMGRREGLLHYGYGAVFPLLVLISAHVVARDPENDFVPWKVFGVAAFISFGLTLRALTTGLGIG